MTVIDNVQLPRDPIVEEVRARGQQVTQRFDHDPKKLFEALDHLALTHPEKMVDQIRVVPSTQTNRRLGCHDDDSR